MNKRLAVALGCASMLAVSAGASAHHSFSSFDMTKTVVLTGTVKDFHWSNPHSWIVLDTVDSSGHPVQATLESNGPGYLVRQGWKRDTLKPGDKISAKIHPMRDGSPGGNLTGVTLPDGQELSAQPTGPRPNTYEDKPDDTGGKNAK